MYSTSTPWRGPTTVSAAAIQAWFRSRNPNAPAGLGQAIYDEATAAGLDAAAVAAQVDEETGSWTSQIALTKNNPAGLGAVDGNALAGALTFPTPQAGIRAQCAHLLSYVLGAANPLKADDPRYSAMPAGWLGTKTTLGDFGNGVWATDPTYAAQLVQRANLLLSFIGSTGGTPTVSVSDIYGVPLAWMPAADGNFDTSRGKVRLFIVHDEEASTAMSAVNRFQTPGQQASSHFVGDPANGRIIQCVGTGNTAYTCGNYALNQVSVNMENPGFEGKPYPDAVVDYCARVGAYCAQKFGIPIVRLSKQQVAAGAAGFCGHEDIPAADGGWGGNDHHTDPGATWPWDRFLALVRQYAGQGSVTPQIVDPPKPVPPPKDELRYFPETQHRIGHGFKAFWEKHDDALQLFGFPLSEEFTENGITVQYFERARFEYHPENKPPYDILLGRVAAEDADRAKQANPEAFVPVQR